MRMGRQPTVNFNLPTGMRRRVMRSGKAFYYLDTGAKPRREIPLGDDYILAIRKYGELVQSDAPKHDPKFADVVTKYLTDILPSLATNTQRVNKSDIKHLSAYFNTAPLSEIEPMHIGLFLEKHKDKPNTANRCKRLFSAMWNYSRRWGYTSLTNPCEGIKGFTLNKREVYITDAVFAAVKKHGSHALKDAMDLAYLTGQRPADALKMTDDDIADGFLIVGQNKTQVKLRITVTGELADLLARIAIRKSQYKIEHSRLLMNKDGKPLTQAVLRNHFADAKADAIKESPELADAINAFWFYDLRAKAADDISVDRGDQDASDLLGHDTVKTTKKHYIRRGKIVEPTR